MSINQKKCFIYTTRANSEKSKNYSYLFQHKKCQTKHITITKPIKLGNTNYSIIKEVKDIPISRTKITNTKQLKIIIDF